MFESSISAAEKNFISYLPKTSLYYEKNRNFSLDLETKKNTTSLLSPYIRYRAISEETILQKLGKSRFECEKDIFQFLDMEYVLPENRNKTTLSKLK